MAVTEKLHATTSRAIGTDSSWIFHIRSTAWSVLDPLLFSFYTCTVGKVISSLFFILLLCWWDSTHPPLTFLRLSLNHISACISACLADLSPWMAAHHLKLNLSKTELLYIPGRALCPNLRKLPGELIQSDHTSWQCMQPLCSSGQSDDIRRIQLILSSETTLLLLQSVFTVSLDYCNFLLATDPNTATCLVVWTSE